MEINISNTELTEQEVKEWVAILVERKITLKLAPPKEGVDKAKVDIDLFRETNGLAPKYKTAQIGE